MMIRRFIYTAIALCALGAGMQAQEKRVVGINDSMYSLTPEEAEAVEFLYKSMPMSDRAMMSSDYYIRSVRTTLLAREEMPWGKSVPDDIWKHFVLPVRSNNEYLDNFRVIYYPELRDRVKNLSMRDAALEINHWLHEKVTYRPSDARTSAPMSTIRTAKGRCGEESVLGVAAFRAVGIPARQVYTPRWAHTDDNHAWVEVWIDGQWHFLGACEPEPELDRAWFNAPASRGMLMHTRVFGQYPGPEQILGVQQGITEINVTDNYVPVRESTVTVLDNAGRPVKGITVEYKIYNYAEFYTAARLKTDAHGKTMLKTGQGDMLAWATDGKYFGFSLVNSTNTVLRLNHKIGEEFSIDLDIVPPVENPIPSKATEEQIAENARRFERENQMRANYEAGFWGGRFCERTKNDLPDYLTPEQLAGAVNYLEKAEGNWQAVFDYLTAVPAARIDEALALLGVISDKDLRDTPSRVLITTLNHTEAQPDNSLYTEYVLNPRISNELLSDYRMTMRIPSLGEGVAPERIIDYVTKNVTVNNEGNAYRVPIIPEKVWKSREADSHSRDIFFVAICRNAGIPARINPVTGECQYFNNSEWVTVNFEQKQANTVAKGTVKGTFTPTDYMTDPEYYRHFTISSLASGAPHLLEFGDDMGESFNSILKEGTELPAGYYMLTSGVRKANGGVSARMVFFNIKAGGVAEVPLTMRHTPGAIEVIGSLNPEELFLPAGAKEPASVLSATGRGYFLIALLGDTDEPSNHAAGELASLAPVLEKWGRPLVLIGRERKELGKFDGLIYGSDFEGRIMKMLKESVKTEKADDNRRLPIIVLADSFGRVVFISEGYDTSLAQKLQSVIPAL